MDVYVYVHVHVYYANYVYYVYCVYYVNYVYYVNSVYYVYTMYIKCILCIFDGPLRMLISGHSVWQPPFFSPHGTIESSHLDGTYKTVQIINQHYSIRDRKTHRKMVI